jgi:LmbE family N-acetylglucosaminyl deacetylase
MPRGRDAMSAVLRSRGSRCTAWIVALLVAIPPAAAAGGLPRIDAGTSLLVVAPHPDDETLCCAGAIRRVVEAGGRASIVWITSGDASTLEMLLVEKRLFAPPRELRAVAVRRMHEARAAASLLGVPAGAQLFLGYPDRGLLELLTAHHDTAYTSAFTASAVVPYGDAVSAGHPYTGASLERDFDAVLARTHPTLVLAPSPLDSHPDHRAAALLTLRVLQRRGELSLMRCWIVHGGEGWPSPRGLYPGLPLTAAPRIPGPAPAVLELTPEEEDRKLAALRAYRTQLELMSPFLLAFVRSTELFWPAP